MATFRLTGAAIIFLGALGGLAIAQDQSPGVNAPAESTYCATRDRGNPHSKQCDYTAWSKWREVGGWDGSLDDACLRNPAFVPAECGLDPASKRSFGFSFPWSESSK